METCLVPRRAGPRDLRIANKIFKFLCSKDLQLANL
jgi:hypothetical protein